MVTRRHYKATQRKVKKYAKQTKRIKPRKQTRKLKGGTKQMINSIKKKLKKQIDLSNDEINSWCYETSPFKFDRKLKKKYTPLLKENLNMIRQKHVFELKKKENEYNELYKTLNIAYKLTEEEEEELNKKEKEDENFDKEKEREKIKERNKIILTEEEEEKLKTLESEFSAIGKEITEFDKLYKKCIPKPKPLKSSEVKKTESFFNNEGRLIESEGRIREREELLRKHEERLRRENEEPMYQSLKPPSNRSIYETLSNRDIIKGKKGSNIRVGSYHSLKASKNSKGSKKSIDSLVGSENMNLFNPVDEHA